MGLDGFSVANLGLHKELTSAQMANNAETLAAKGSDRTIKDVGEIAKKKKGTRKSFEQEDEDPVYFFEEDEDDGKKRDNHSQKYLNQNKRYKVRLNQKNQLIELLDQDSGEVIATITPSDLMKLVSRLSSTSGILVNRRI